VRSVVCDASVVASDSPGASRGVVAAGWMVARVLRILVLAARIDIQTGVDGHQETLESGRLSVP
jgi:hypothetical protein